MDLILIDYSQNAVVFCIHGNKWGVATCCEDLDTSDGQPLVTCRYSRGQRATHPAHFQLGGGYQSTGSFDDDGSDTDSNDSLHCHTNRDEGIDKK